MKYYLHRISCEAEWSHPLLEEKKLLSIGWSVFAASEYWPPDQQDFSRIRENIKKCYQEWNPTRSSYGLQRFLEMKKGDRVIVPSYKVFHVYEIEENECLVAADIERMNIDNIKSWSGKRAFIEDNYLKEIDGNKNTIDLGFFRKVKEIRRNISRAKYADVALTRRMKVLQTNVEITDIGGSVKEAIAAFDEKSPINLREELLDNCAKVVLKKILNKVPSHQFEKLIKRFFESQGASAIIPPKNERDTEGDADIVATFDFLSLIVYVQAKRHEGKTDGWAVEQIKNYKESKENGNAKDEFTRIAWVISSAEEFSKDCINLAQVEGVRLINGIEFAKMLLDAGMAQLDYSVEA